VNAFAFSRDDVCAIHSAAIARFGGLDGVRDEGMLASALAQPFQTFGGEELYPFLDGNKRTGAALLGTYLRMCGVGFAPDHAEFLSAMLGVADGSMSYEELVDWVRINVG